MDNKNSIKIFAGVIGLLVVGVIIAVVMQSKSTSTPPGPGKYDTFAECLKDKGATFYGAFWCPHCQATKKLFGSSAKLLPYVECALPDASGQNKICNDNKITGYPTWEFADKSRLTGELTLQQLADKTSCTLPQ